MTTPTLLLPIETLRCYDLVLITLVMLALDVLVHVWSRRGTQLSPQETVLLKQYNEQVAIVNRLNSVETFVEQSKAIRKMNTVKKQMQELAVERMQKAAPSSLQKRVNQLRTPVVMGLLGVLYWNQPLVVLPQGYMVPFERLLSFPGFPFGAISAVGWAGVCRRVGTKLLG